MGLTFYFVGYNSIDHSPRTGFESNYQVQQCGKLRQNMRTTTSGGSDIVMYKLGAFQLRSRNALVINNIMNTHFQRHSFPILHSCLVLNAVYGIGKIAWLAEWETTSPGPYECRPPQWKPSSIFLGETRR